MKQELKQYYYENGQIENRRWYLNGKLHNENEPAVVYYYQNEYVWNNLKISSQFYYLNGKQYTEEEFKKYKLIKELSGVI